VISAEDRLRRHGLISRGMCRVVLGACGFASGDWIPAAGAATASSRAAASRPLRQSESNADPGDARQVIPDRRSGVSCL